MGEQPDFDAEADRQAIVLALATLAGERPGWGPYLRGIAERHRGAGDFDTLRAIDERARKQVTWPPAKQQAALAAELEKEREAHAETQQQWAYAQGQVGEIRQELQQARRRERHYHAAVVEIVERARGGLASMMELARKAWTKSTQEALREIDETLAAIPRGGIDVLAAGPTRAAWPSTPPAGVGKSATAEQELEQEGKAP